MQRIPLNDLTFWLMRYGSKQANMNLYKSESSFKGAIRMTEKIPATEVMVAELKEWDKKYGSSFFGMGKDKIIVGLTWSLCGHDYEAKPPINKENWLSHNSLSCPPLHVKPPKLLLLPT